jgi:hypothetical protein
VSSKQLQLIGLSILCVFIVLLGIRFIFRQEAPVRIDRPSVTRNASIVLDDERRRLAAGSWQAIPINIAYKGLLGIDLRVASGNPIDVALIDGNQLDLLANKGWSHATKTPGFTASRVDTYQKSAEIVQGSYYLVYRDATLGVVSPVESEVKVKITLSSF